MWSDDGTMPPTYLYFSSVYNFSISINNIGITIAWLTGPLTAVGRVPSFANFNSWSWVRVSQGYYCFRSSLNVVKAHNGPHSLGSVTSCSVQQQKHSVLLDFTVTVQNTADMQSLISAFQSYIRLLPHWEDVEVSKVIIGKVSITFFNVK